MDTDLIWPDTLTPFFVVPRDWVLRSHFTPIGKERTGSPQVSADARPAVGLFPAQES